MSGDVKRGGLLSGIVERFLDGPSAMLLLILALVLGAASISFTPREEEPQIVVPIADVFIEVPGHSPQEVDRLVTTPLARLLWQIDGVEHVQSASMQDRSVVTVRFFVGEDREDSITLLRNRIQSHLDDRPAAVSSWLVRPIEIDDVPIVTVTLSGEGFDMHALRRVGEEMRARLDALPELSRTEIIGGLPREVRVELDRERLSAHGLSPLDIVEAIRRRSAHAVAGTIDELDQRLVVDVGDGFRDTQELEELTVAIRGGAPVHLREVADIVDGPSEVRSYTRLASGAASSGGAAEGVPSVTLSVAKQKGTDATSVAARVVAEVDRLSAEVLPEGLEAVVTRNYGETANEKVDELLQSIGFALVTVVLLLLFTLGWREALVVALAVPVSFSLALFVNLLFGFTINRVTLFALILSLGLVVDDPITNVDNIERHLRLGIGTAKERILAAVSEVLPPVVMSTLTIVVSFLPMFFITGMMGPYMEPMAANVPLTVGFSTLAALTIVPWLAFQLLGKKRSKEGAPSEAPPEPEPKKKATLLARAYRRFMRPVVSSRWAAWATLGAVVLLFVAANSLAVTGRVPLKMLPFADKNDLSVMLDMPEGTSLEATDAAARELERFLSAQPEVLDVQAYVGEAAPMDFNGMVRHSYLRNSAEFAELRARIVPPEQRQLQSHELGLRLRDGLAEIAERHGALMRLVEMPPGPPVLATLVAEVYGSDGQSYEALVEAAGEVAERMEATEGVREVDVMAPSAHERLHFTVDRRRADVHGIDEHQTSALLALAIGGTRATTLRDSHERQPLPVIVRLPRDQRSDIEELNMLPTRTQDGSLLALGEVGDFERRPAGEVIYQKDLRAVVYVMAEVVGIPPAEAVLALQSDLAENPLPPGIEVDWAGEGEWAITLRVFRDLGLAFGAALLLIYLLLVVETRSAAMPLLVMMAIPLTTIGIMPGFWLLNLVTANEIGGYGNPVFFTATAMIGMIALGGIVVRNSLVLIEFVEDALAKGVELEEALIESGVVRMRPILLTAGTTALGAWPITMDPVFSGLAWSLVFGLVASTAFTLVVVPATYLLTQGRRKKSAAEPTEPEPTEPEPVEPAEAAEVAAS